MSMKQYFAALIGLVSLIIAVYFALQYYQGELAVGSDLVTPIAGQTYTLAGSGISSSETSFTLTSFTVTQNGYRIQDSDMSDIFYVTLEPGSRSRQEIVSCTTVVQNADGTATISGCTRGLSPIYPYTASSSLQFAHSGGSSVIFSDPPQLLNQASFKDNDETITGSWLFPTPLNNENAATKAYVDALVSGTTTLQNEALVVAGTAGETLATSTLVYLNPATQRWNGVSTASSTTFDDRFIGITQGRGTNGSAIAGGVMLKGRHVKSTGLTPGSLYYATTATGSISVTPSAQTIGIAVASDVLYFDPVWVDVPHENANNTFTATNTFNGTTTINGFFTGATKVDVFTSSGTWTKGTSTRFVDVIVIGAGGGGGGGRTGDVNAAGGGGGQGGGLSSYTFNAQSLTSTVAVTVGTGGSGGTSNNDGGNGGSSSFGSYLIATGGNGADNENGGNGAGLGNIANGTNGGTGVSASAGNAGVATTLMQPTGGGSGGGKQDTTGFVGSAGGARSTIAVLAGGTAGAIDSGTGGAGNSFSSIDGIGGTGGGGGGGDAGENANGGNGGAGAYPGGGGGGGGSAAITGGFSGGTGGTGGNGIVIVVSY